MVIPNVRLQKVALLVLPAVCEIDGLGMDTPTIHVVAQAQTKHILGPDVVAREPIKAVLEPRARPLFVNST